MTEPDALFVYGTLMFPEVLEVLLGRTPEMAPAALDGWRAAALVDRVYPGLVAADGLMAAGHVLLGLDPDEHRILDAFEEETYERRAVVLADGRTAVTYVWVVADAVLPTDWDPAHFATTELPRYVERWSTWRRSLEDSA